MAKRKSTDKPSSNETEDKVDVTDVTDAADPSEDHPTDADTVADAVEAVEIYAPADRDKEETTTDGALDDDAIELAEPEKTSEPAAEEPSEEGSTETPDVDATEATIAAETADSDGATGPETTADDAPNSDDADISAEPSDPSPPPVTPQAVRETVVERKGGFGPMLLGGAVAAVLGYGVAAYVSQDVWPFVTGAEEDAFAAEMRDSLAAQDGALTELSERLATLEGAEPPVVDLSPLETRIAQLQDGMTDLTARLDEIAGRIDTLERQPMEQAVSPEAIAAYERALADLQAEVEAQRAEVEQMAQEAVTAETNATEQAQLAAARTAMADVTAALETGSGFSGALDVLSLNGIDVPAPLRDVSEGGVPSQVALIGSFPEAARAALSAVRSTETETAEGTSRIATFLANQLGARSVAPREGNDPDAVLSRSEAALRAGDLDTALSELSALPEVAQAAMADWRTRAETRLAAKQAADTLVQQLLQK